MDFKAAGYEFVVSFAVFLKDYNIKIRDMAHFPDRASADAYVKAITSKKIAGKVYSEVLVTPL